MSVTDIIDTVSSVLSYKVYDSIGYCIFNSCVRTLKHDNWMKYSISSIQKSLSCIQLKYLNSIRRTCNFIVYTYRIQFLFEDGLLI